MFLFAAARRRLQCGVYRIRIRINKHSCFWMIALTHILFSSIPQLQSRLKNSGQQHEQAALMIYCYIPDHCIPKWTFFNTLFTVDNFAYLSLRIYIFFQRWSTRSCAISNLRANFFFTSLLTLIMKKKGNQKRYLFF